ncbi:MAG: GspE/PulE family protein, partial [Oscillospiraceae bacterium]
MQLLSALAKKMNIHIKPLDDIEIDFDAVKKISRKMAEKYCLIPVSIDGECLTIIMNDPLNFYAVEDVRLVTNMPVIVALDEKKKIERKIEICYGEIEAKQVVNIANESSTTSGNATSIEELGDMAAHELESGDDQRPVIKLLNSLLSHGYNINASDIHIEPFEKETRVRMRVDGMLIDYLILAKNLHPSLIARTKIMSNLDIAEKRVPQDGHIKTIIDGIEMNIRVSTLPTMNGEKAVLRYLNSATKVTNSEHFGMNDENYMKFAKMMNSPNGIIYITGPTGSGKTTTLYMALDKLAQKQVNISTIEDPVERNIDRVNQVQVNTVSGLTFGVGLRSLLRQDPDIIMVGETRDAETAQISVRCSITGHLVLSTLHTNDAISSIVRLEDMGVEPFMVANSVVGLMAQRLVRTICPACKQAYEPSLQEQELLHGSTKTLYRGTGCAVCNQTGYKGRTAVHEVVVIDKPIKQLISQRAPLDDIYQYAKKAQGFKTLVECAEELVLSGQSTTDELVKLLYNAD